MYFLLQGCNVPEISLLNLKNPCVSFFKAIMQKGTKFISLFWTMKTMISSDFVGECYWVEISQSFSLHNGSHRSLCRHFAIHTVSQVIFTFIWQVFTLYRYCRAEVNQCRTWPHGLWRELGACRNVAHASRSDKNTGVDSLGRKNHR